MNHVQTTLDSCVKGLLGALLLLFASFIKDGFAVLNICVAEVDVEVFVRNLCCKTELAGIQVVVDLLGCGVELVEDVALRQRLFSTLGSLRLGGEGVSQSSDDILGSLVDLVTEPSVSVNDVDIERNILDKCQYCI